MGCGHYLFLKTGNCLRLGGSFQSHDDFRVSPYTNYTMIHSSSIELLALLYSLKASIVIGLRWRRRAVERGLRGWDEMAGHLVVVVDTLTAVNNILAQTPDGYFSLEYFDPLVHVLGEEQVDRCICYEIGSNLSYAVAAFERITFLQRKQLPDTYHANSGMGNWQMDSWFPDVLAKQARERRDDRVDLSEIGQDRWVEFAVKSKVVVHNKSCDGFLVRASVMAYPVMANIL